MHGHIIYGWLNFMFVSIYLKIVDNMNLIKKQYFNLSKFYSQD